MAHRIREGHDVVFASPYAYGGGVVGASRLRIFLSHLANSFVKGALEIRGLLTVSSFYRLYRGSAIRRLQMTYGESILECAGFECMVELAMKLMYLGMSISEVPMTLDAGQRIGKSKMRITKTGLGYLRLFRLRRRWRAVAGAQPGELVLGWSPVVGAVAPPFELVQELEGRVAEVARSR
jgi:dolichol-phosphate mannosyltransferase